ncbi:MAG: adenine phosphoribosyltransferase [Bacillota bacterium]|nr:adenine phosphoribosyltransferase [Bacillota bacterium]
MDRKLKSLKETIRIVEDFPVKGISFKDITTVIHSGEQFANAIELMSGLVEHETFDYFIGPEARGFIFGAPLACKLGKGFIPVRKKGKLPFATASYSYDLEYGKDEVFVHMDSIKSGDRVVIVDDLLATGGTARAVAELVKKLGGEVVCFLCLIELDDLGGRNKLEGLDVRSLIHYDH